MRGEERRASSESTLNGGFQMTQQSFRDYSKYMEGNERTSSENTLNGGFQMTLRSFGDYSKYMQTLQNFGDYLKDMRGVRRA